MRLLRLPALLRACLLALSAAPLSAAPVSTAARTAGGPVGAVLRVGPGQPFPTIAAALAVAQDGDVIAVDPGSYPPFVVDNRSITITSSGGAALPFTVARVPGQPSVTVQNTSPLCTVTLLHFATTWPDGSAPAILLQNCQGPVRIDDAAVDLTADLANATARAAVEVVGCAVAWCSDLRVTGAAVRTGNTVSLPGAPVADNGGLCALVAENSALVLDHAELHAFRNQTPVNGVTWGGDALRLVGASSAWLVREFGGTPSVLRAGAGATFGGSVVHQVRPSAAGYLVVCGPLQSVRGAGSVAANRGGLLSLNGDRGVISLPPVAIERALAVCILEAYGAVTLPGRELHPGFTVSLTVSSFFARPYALVIAPTTTFASGLAGDRLLFDHLAGTAVLLGFGVLPASAVAAHPVSVPANAALVGLHLTFQGVLGAPLNDPGPDLALTLPVFAVVTP